MPRRRLTRRLLAGGLLAVACIGLSGCSYLWEPGVRLAADGTVQVRPSPCEGRRRSDQPVKVSVERWNGNEYDVVWETTDVPVTPTGQVIIDPDALGLRRSVEYGVTVETPALSWDGGFTLDQLPRDGSYLRRDVRYPNTPAGRTRLDEVACDVGGGPSMGAVLALGAALLVGGAVVAAALVVLVRWLARRGAPPSQAQPF